MINAFGSTTNENYSGSHEIEMGSLFNLEVKKALSTCDIKMDISKMISYSGEE